MAPSLDTTILCQQWVHSKEEDTVDGTVYRPVGFAFPPSRGRSGLEFNAEGKFKWIGTGSTDVSAVTQGTWQIVEPGTGRIQININNAPEDLAIRSLEKNRLVIQKRQ